MWYLPHLHYGSEDALYMPILCTMNGDNRDLMKVSSELTVTADKAQYFRVP